MKKIKSQVKSYTAATSTNNSQEQKVLRKLISLEYFILNPDVAANNMEPFSHFLNFGRYEQRSISLLFDKSHISSAFNDLLSEDQDAHFSDAFFHSDNENIGPAKWLDIDYIRSRNKEYSDSPPFVILDAILDSKIIDVHPLFDENFYRAQLQLRALSIQGPALLHYLHHGWKLALEPHPLFDSWYFQENSAPPAHKAPWLYYLESEKHWNLAISPFVDEGYLNHQLAVSGLKKPDYYSPIAFALQSNEVSADMLHPNLTHSLVDYLKKDGDVLPYELNEISHPADLVELVSALRTKKDTNIGTSSPKVSVIIVNYRKPVLTLLSVLSAGRALADVSHEILLVDNDGSAFENELYYRYLGHISNITIIPTTKNLYFGEGNNIAIDRAAGQYVWFMNNDAFADKFSAAKLISVLDNNANVGAVGPVMFDAALNIGEAGGLVSPFGEVVQLAKSRKLDKVLTSKLSKMGRRVVDYVSAASLLMRTEILRTYGGFDYAYEPFYYEDTDLCLRIKRLNFDVEVVNDAYCLHLENTSTREFLTDKFNSTVMRSREKFFARWVMDNEYKPRSCEFIGEPNSSNRTVAIYSPFQITMGGGENYILSLAAAAARHMHVTFITDIPTSITRFAFVLRDLGIENFPFAISTKDECSAQEFDLAIVMGNEIIPPWIPRAKHFIYHCQFPFPINHSTRHTFGRNRAIDSYVVNSEFTKRAITEQSLRYGLEQKPIDIVSPPVNLSQHDLATVVKAKFLEGSTVRFTSVGRFFASGHCKRQDVIARVLNRVSAKLDIVGEIYGGLSTSVQDQEFYQSVKVNEVPSKLTVNANVGRDIIETSMEHAHYYIHAAGLGVNVAVNPHQCEHFGITVVEAMANGCIPIVFAVGGPAEILKRAGVGYTFSTEEELEQIVTSLATKGIMSKDVIESMAKAYTAAEEYSRENFYKHMLKLVDKTFDNTDKRMCA